MNYLLIFIAEVFFLFFFSRVLTRSLSFLPINAISFLFLPGIIIHELSHFLVASLLFVPTGDIEFMPQLTDGGLKLGSVGIARTDPIRRFLIGVAPILAGLSLIVGIFYFVLNNGLFNGWILLLVSYIIFAVGNTMFSSKKDMEGAVVLLVFAFIIILASYFAGIRVSFSFSQNSIFLKVIDNFKQVDLYLLILITLDGVIYSLVKLLRK